MPLELGKAIYQLLVDSTGMDAGLKEADAKVTAATQQINTKTVAMAAAIGGAIGSIVTAISSKLLTELDKMQSFFSDSVKVTQEFGMEMERLGSRMGMTAQDAAVLTSQLAESGLGSGMAARSMQMLAMQMHQTSESVDPLNTKLGKALGTLRDTNGQMLGLSQTLDLARQKIVAAGSATEKLEIAQQIFGARGGGQMVLALDKSNEEWEKQKAAVQASIGPVQEAAEEALKYQAASVELDDTLRSIQLTIGTKLLPIVIDLTHGFTDWIQSVEQFKASDPVGQVFEAMLETGGQVVTMWKELNLRVLEFQELIGAPDKKTSAEGYFLLGGDVGGYKKEIENATKAYENLIAKSKEAAKSFDVNTLDPDKLAQYVKAMNGLMPAMEKAFQLGLVSDAQRKESLQKQLELLDKQISDEQVLTNLKGADNEAVRVEAEKNILKYRAEQAELVSKESKEAFETQQLQAKAAGEFNSSTEMQFLQQRLQDATLVGDERLKIEGELFTKQKAYQEEVMKIGRELGIASAQDEIKFREQKAKELLGSGDITGAAGEMKKIQDLRIKEGDDLLNWEKKYQVLSIGYEIDFQKQKLEVVKGNAAEERKVLESIADLDKELYDKRLSYATNYSSSIQGQYDAIMKAAKSSGDVQSFEQAKVAGDRQLLETAQQAAQVTHGGGTTEQREGALKFAAFVDKMEIDQKQSGQEQSDMFKQVLDYVQQIKRSAGLDTRDVTGPGAAVSSITAPSEGLATTSLARGTEIPRLDTSYTDLAVRIRDTFLNAIPNINAFADAVSKAAVKITGGNLPNPINLPPGGGLGPGGGPTVGAPGASLQALPNGPGTPAQPQAGGTGTVTVGGTTLQLGQGGQPSDAIASLRDTTTANTAALKDLQDNLTDFKVVFGNLVDAMKNQKVSVSVDPNSKEGIVAVALQGGTEALQ